MAWRVKMSTANGPIADEDHGGLLDESFDDLSAPAAMAKVTARLADTVADLAATAPKMAEVGFRAPLTVTITEVDRG
jgi:hypothetical protein